MRRLLIVAWLIAGCASAPRPTPLELGDRAFAGGDTASAEQAYAQAATTAKDPDDVFRERFLALLARRAAKGPAQFDATLAGLRKLAADAAGNRWGRLAALYADEMTQADALRWALQRAGADISRLQAKAAALEAELGKEKQTNGELAASLDAVKQERGQLEHDLHDLQTQLADRNSALSALTTQLEALKDIDLSHGP